MSSRLLLSGIVERDLGRERKRERDLGRGKEREIHCSIRIEWEWIETFVHFIIPQ